jgi:hypothetical protein
MARQLLVAALPQADLSAGTRTVTVSQGNVRLSAHALAVRLRQPRSKAYVEAMTRLDAGGHCCSRDAIDALVRQINQEMPEIVIESQPIGILAQCYLGSPYEVHTLDRVGQIVTHYKAGESISPLFDRGRALALHPAYAFVEIYLDKIVPVDATGTPSFTANGNP